MFDASERNNLKPALEIDAVTHPGAAFELARFGPFLVVRTREPVVTPDRYLLLAGRAQLLGRSLGIGDADVNLLTVERAAAQHHDYGASAPLLSTARSSKGRSRTRRGRPASGAVGGGGPVAARRPRRGADGAAEDERAETRSPTDGLVHGRIVNP